MALYHAANGPQWTVNENWLSDAPIGEWHGVLTDSTGRVTGLVLADNGLGGKLPAELNSIASLAILNLLSEPLGGTLSGESGALPSQATSPAGGDQAVGDAMESMAEGLGDLLSGLTGILAPSEQTGDESVDPMAGTLTEALTAGLTVGLQSIEELSNSVDLLNSRLTAELSPEMRNVAVLMDASLSINRMSGKLPTRLGKYAGLSILKQTHAQMGENPPPELADLAKLIELSLVVNQYSGKLPAKLTKFASVTILNNLNDQLGEDAPPELGNFVELVNVSTDVFQSRRGLSTDLSRLTVLSLLTIFDQGQLSGEVPAELVDELGNTDSLETLDLDVALLAEELVEQVNDLAIERNLDVDAEQVTAELDNLQVIRSLNEDEYRAIGQLPVELGNLTSLTVIDLSGNRLGGCVPGSLQIQLDLAASDLGGLPFCP